MTVHRGLWAGFAVLAALSGCSSEDKTLNVEGAYSPVIADLSSSIEPPARGVDNLLTAVVTNTRGYPLTFHWSAGDGRFSDSTSQSVHWEAPDTVGIIPVTVAVQAYDDLNKVSFYASRTFQVHVENEYIRWTKSSAVQFDVAPPVLGKIHFAQIRNSATGESDLWSVSSPLGASEQVTQSFFMATSPSVQADGSQVVFLGRKRSTDPAGSIYLLSSGAPDTSSVLVSSYNVSKNGFLSGPRFSRTGSMFLYHSDTTAFNYPRPWIRDAANLFVAPQRVVPAGSETQLAYVNSNWNGVGDSIVVRSFDNWPSVFRASRGLFKLCTFPSSNPTPFTTWLADSGAGEADWSPDGQFIVFTRIAPGRTDRDLYIVRAASSDKATALPVTHGPADDAHPRFSADSKSIFFVSNRADRYGLNGVFETERRGTNIWSVSGFDLP